MHARLLHSILTPQGFYRLAGRAIPWILALTLILLVVGGYLGLFVAPPDYQQGESVRIIYVHVPAAWMSLFVYVVMACASAVAMIWRVKLADVIAASSAPIGAWFTFLALATGSLWGKPMWGTWWVWDARLTSELILLFLYLGYIGLRAAIDDRRTAMQAGAILALVGVINVPIIHFSVEWWNTLHQGSTVVRAGGPAIHLSMLVPLLVMALGFKLFYLAAMLMRARNELLSQERRSRWVKDLVTDL